jgi:hypothetical protein
MLKVTFLGLLNTKMDENRNFGSYKKIPNFTICLFLKKILFIPKKTPIWRSILKKSWYFNCYCAGWLIYLFNYEPGSNLCWKNPSICRLFFITIHYQSGGWLWFASLMIITFLHNEKKPYKLLGFFNRDSNLALNWTDP